MAQHRQPVVVGREQWKDPRCKLFPELPEEGIYESALALPILLPNGELFGVIGLVAKRAPRELLVYAVRLSTGQPLHELFD